MLRTLKRLVREDSGMEMVEWAIVGVVFALGAALIWSNLGTSIGNALDDIGNCVDGGTCPDGTGTGTGTGG
jgi:Flp pilus assembly pilin Flp